MNTVGKYLVALLDAYGIEIVFGIPGVHTIELYRGLSGSKIRHVLPRHEQGAGFMADGYARASGRPAACFIITGPGMTNIATAMGQAYGDSVPMLVVSTVNSFGQLGSGDGWLHELQDQRQLVKQVAAFSYTITAPEELPFVVARAFAVFNSARPRPVHIELPINIISASADSLPPIAPRPSPFRPSAAPDAIRQVSSLLNSSSSPLLLVGGGSQDSSKLVRELAERLDAPAVMTVNGRGILPNGHSLAVPCSPSQRPVGELIEESDLILALGTELGPTDYDWAEKGLAKFHGTSIRIDIDHSQLARSQLVDFPIVADVNEALGILLPEITKKERNGAARAAKVRNAILEGLTPIHKACLEVLNSVRDSLPEAIVVGDSTQPSYAGCAAYESPAPRSWFCSATGYGTLGYALPAAIGAKLSAPSRPVVCVVGDGGLQFSMAELATARELEFPLIVLLWNNRGYSEIRSHMLANQVEPIGVEMYVPDFQLLARGFGCNAIKLGPEDALAEHLKSAVRLNRPTLIEIAEENLVMNAEIVA